MLLLRRRWGWTNIASSGSTRITLQEWDEAWALEGERAFEMKKCSLAPHDFALTTDYAVFVEVRAVVYKKPSVPRASK